MKILEWLQAAAWADVAGDKKKELIICGAWMTPEIFQYDGNQFKEIKTNLSDMFGWWRSIKRC